MPPFQPRHASRIISKYSGYFLNFRRPITKSCHFYSHLNYTLHLYASNRHFASSKQQQQSNTNQHSVPTPMTHHYTTLNVDSDASIDDVKKSYNNLIKQWHPDLYASKPTSQQQDAQQKFMLIREAYEIVMSHKQLPQHQTKQTDKPDIHKQSAFAKAKRTPHASYSYYSWGRKVYESQQAAEQTEEKDDNKEEEEQKYSESYEQNKTWIAKTMEELYDWVVFLYMRNPSWMQFFLIATACFGVVQCLWHLFYPNINDADPDRIWNVFKLKKRNTGMEYQPSTTAAMQSTPNIVALQPHFKGHTVYDNDGKNDNIFEGDADEDFSDVEKDSAWMMFAKLNLNSTVNRDLFKIGKKKKKESNEEKMEMSEQNSNEQMETVEIKKEEKSKEIKLQRPVVEYKDIPLELRSNPMGLLLASCAADTGELRREEENGQYDWSVVIDKYRKLNEQNEKDLQTQ